MIPENQLLGSLRESSISWFRPAKVHLTNEQLLELRDEENSIYFGCWNGYDGPEWGMERYKTLSDLENEHGKALHVKINWNGKTEGIMFSTGFFRPTGSRRCFLTTESTRRISFRIRAPTP